jgi:hypothetical protein
MFIKIAKNLIIIGLTIVTTKISFHVMKKSSEKIEKECKKQNNEKNRR